MLSRNEFDFPKEKNRFYNFYKSRYTLLLKLVFDKPNMGGGSGTFPACSFSIFSEYIHSANDLYDSLPKSFENGSTGRLSENSPIVKPSENVAGNEAGPRPTQA